MTFFFLFLYTYIYKLILNDQEFLNSLDYFLLCFIENKITLM